MAWLKLNRDDRDSMANRARHEQVASKRLNHLISSANSVEDEDSAEVEARLRNLTHGTSSK